jgi:hypothetical protein
VTGLFAALGGLITEAVTGAVRPGAFTIIDVFDAPSTATIEAVTLTAHRRQQAARKDEMNMAVAYYWWAMWLPRLAPGGMIDASKPAPLSADQLAEVMRQITLHPTYRGNLIQAFDADGGSVRLEAGRVVKGGMPAMPGGGRPRGGFNG